MEYQQKLEIHLEMIGKLEVASYVVRRALKMSARFHTYRHAKMYLQELSSCIIGIHNAQVENLKCVDEDEANDFNLDNFIKDNYSTLRDLNSFIINTRFRGKGIAEGVMGRFIRDSASSSSHVWDSRFINKLILKLVQESEYFIEMFIEKEED